MHTSPSLRTIARASALACVVLTLPATSAGAEAHAPGAGSWPCSEIVEIMETGERSLVGQVAGWAFGDRSAASFRRETGFVDTIEEVGADTILRKTVQECRNAPLETFRYTLANAMIAKTK